jgi:hypothetical protein
MNVSEKDLLFISDERHSTITACLSKLRTETGAECILLVDIKGQLILKVGEIGELDVTNLVSLQAGGFATTFEMSKYLGEQESTNLNFYEGVSYDIYSANVGDRLFITLIFDRRVQTNPIGMVWLYTKRTIRELLDIISTADKIITGPVFDDEFNASLRDELDNVFDTSPGRE